MANVRSRNARSSTRCSGSRRCSTRPRPSPDSTRRSPRAPRRARPGGVGRTRPGLGAAARRDLFEAVVADAPWSTGPCHVRAGWSTSRASPRGTAPASTTRRSRRSVPMARRARRRPLRARLRRRRRRALPRRPRQRRVAQRPHRPPNSSNRSSRSSRSVRRARCECGAKFRRRDARRSRCFPATCSSWAAWPRARGNTRCRRSRRRAAAQPAVPPLALKQLVLDRDRVVGREGGDEARGASMRSTCQPSGSSGTSARRVMMPSPIAFRYASFAVHARRNRSSRSSASNRCQASNCAGVRMRWASAGRRRRGRRASRSTPTVTPVVPIANERGVAGVAHAERKLSSPSMRGRP